ncbi:hypothetical protein IX317_001174 [Fusobacterium sp. DD29]|uniref:TRAP transporter small permease n=1 Tax=unclassified Fusobacterium TaxID=2648384 RepID=UPI001B8D1613|nr:MULTISPECIES: TRAP transporter small permease [unclassified Fusobacterium]MBR8749500.1 hypothetical protein [Fusobacterium sp. DD29]MBR8761761.1 hypothetical protein [Fusobacterium sp. DD25]MBR8767779.1 hypothetical protein [Fusobacterium sp. DD43]MBR8771800.1 hypothetical protein [Fusobacterium sp. DD40]MBR8776055.1 hypothetical protein [Fusobacterium sp. DD17]
MKNIQRTLQKTENFIMVISFSIMVLACFIQVVNRNIFKIPVSGFEEAAKYSMIYMVLLGTELGLRDGTQIAVTGAVDKLKGKTRKIVVIISKLLVIGFSSAIFYQSILLVQQQIRSGQKSPGLQIPMTIPYFALVLSFGIITIVQLINLILICKSSNSNKEEVKE